MFEWYEEGTIHRALANFYKVRHYKDTKVFTDIEVYGNVVDGGGIWLDGHPPSSVETAVRDNPRSLEKVDSYITTCLFQHLKHQSPLFKFVNDWREILVEDISEELIGILSFVAHRGTFGGTSCEICKPWYQ